MESEVWQIAALRVGELWGRDDLDDLWRVSFYVGLEAEAIGPRMSWLRWSSELFPKMPRFGVTTSCFGVVWGMQGLKVPRSWHLVSIGKEEQAKQGVMEGSCIGFG